MAEKLGNGGYSNEAYDEETGKYIEDGQPNSSYNNTNEFSEGKNLGAKRGQLPYSELVDDGLSIDRSTEEKEKQFKEQCTKELSKETGMSIDESRIAYDNLFYYLAEPYFDLPKEDMQKMIKSVNETLSKMGSYNGQIYRGLHYDTSNPSKKGMERYYKMANKLMESARTGTPIQLTRSNGDEMLSSWTSNSTISDEYSYKDRPGYKSIMFTCKNNKSGVPIRHLAVYQWEDEVLCPSNIQYKVKSCNEKIIKDRNGTNKRVLYVELEEI